MLKNSSFSSVISNRDFRFLWINQILIQLAYNTLNFALIIWVYRLTDSNLAVAFLMLAVYLPSFVFGLFAGVFVDKMDKRKIILYIDFLLAVGFLIFALVRNSYPLILVNTFFMNSLAQFFMPTESSSIPMTVSKKQLFFANSLFTLTLYGSFMIGFSVAGPILNFFNSINAIFIFGFTAMVFAWALSQNLPELKAKNFKETNFNFYTNHKYLLALTISETKLTLKFIRGKLNIIVAIGLLASIQGMIGILAVLISSYMEKVLRIHATDASYVLVVPLGLGMVWGAFMIAKYGNSIPRRFIVRPAVITAGIIFLLMGMTPFLATMIQSADLPEHIPRLRFFFAAPTLSILFAFGAFLLGVCTVSIIVPAQTILQENTTEKNRGKIFSVLLVLMNGVAVIPVILAGALSDLFGVSPIFVVLGIMIFIIGVIVTKPASFFKEDHLSNRMREFLGVGHWNE